MLPFLWPSADENILYVFSDKGMGRPREEDKPDQCPAESSAGLYARSPGRRGRLAKAARGDSNPRPLPGPENNRRRWLQLNPTRVCLGMSLCACL